MRRPEEAGDVRAFLDALLVHTRRVEAENARLRARGEALEGELLGRGFAARRQAVEGLRG